MFNPIRPIDGGAQQDADGDGVGDPCDPTPIGSDIDGDGVANDADNCPLADNPSQPDGDTDGKGDMCDFCPSTPNPDGVCPIAAVRIEEIQNGTIATGEHARVEGVVVTAIAPYDIMVQDPSPTSGPAYSGIRVHMSSVPASIAVGDVVDVEGTVTEFFDDTELDNAVVTETGGSMSIAATPLTVAQATTEPYEGVLVRLTDGAVTAASYDCSVTPPCTDSDLWEIDGAAGVVVDSRYYGDADYASHNSELPVTGVMSYRFTRRRISPRTAADFGP